MAKELADLNKKVLIIDSDMRKPKMHTIFGTNNVRGLSNLLVDDTLKYQDLLQEVANIKNLKFISSGPSNKNTVRLLESNKTRELIKK